MERQNFNNSGKLRQPKALFCIYAPDDESFYRKLQTAFDLWRRQKFITWLEIQPGEDIKQNTYAQIQRADLILLLISRDFFADDGCYRAMEASLDEQTSRGIPVILILARASSWKESPCASLRALPDNKEPIASWKSPDEAYMNIHDALAHLVSPSSAPDDLTSIRPRPFQAPKLPKGYVPRPTTFNKIKFSLLNQRDSQTTVLATALRGAGGFGKTTLAIALCHDVEIQKAFPGGILWIEMGIQPPQTLDLLNRLLDSLEPAHTGAMNLEEAHERLREVLKERVCLLVIDDVWDCCTGLRG
jgi:hypothetical protein